ncbi:MAG: NADH:flavin oxidoreductase [Proteobacteria bacterium]|nr:NADH:flavin oxidoreductase [Pseudomonadota bacterium]
MKLFEPIRIGHIEVKNRVAFAPTHMGQGTARGEVDDQVLCHYYARAKGGAGLIIVQAMGVTGQYAFTKGRGIVCMGELYRPGLRELAEVIHMAGSRAVVQLLLGQGAQALYRHSRRDLVAPSEIAVRVETENMPKALRKLGDISGDTARALTPDEIESLIQKYASAAGLVKEAGFDGVEIHGAHGYLIGEFVSPLFNQRQDEYGGSFEKRLTLPLRLIEAVREAGGPRFIVGYRLSGDEHVPGGLDLEGSIRVASRLVEAGLDYIHLSSGCYQAINWVFPDREGVMLPEARAFKAALDVPVICPNIHNPRTAEQALADDDADMISLSRALIADPEWPAKAAGGRAEEINRCVFCYNCVRGVIFDRVPVRCTRNPEVGWERFNPKYWPRPGSTKAD